MKRLAQGILLAVTFTAGNVSSAGSVTGISTEFVTSIHCKTVAGRLVSTCNPLRQRFGPPVCTAQALQIDQPVRHEARTLFAVRRAEGGAIGHYAFHWRCFHTNDQTEVLSLDIVGIENTRDEDVWLLDHQGKRLPKRAESQVFRTLAWRKANSGEQLTGQGVVLLPAINE